MVKKILFLFAVLISLSFSINIPADFKNERSHLYPDEPYHFDTGGMQIEPSMTCEITSSDVANPVLEGRICTGTATICPGTTIRITPTHRSKWAISNPTIYSFFSLLDRCEMENYGGHSTNLNIKWLSDSIYEKYDKDSSPGFAGEDFALYYEGDYRGPQLYEELGTFYLESVTYKAKEYESSDPCSGPQYNKKGEGNVFCNGDIEVLRKLPAFPAFQVLSSEDIDETLTGTESTFTNEGRYTLRTRIKNAECFAALMKYPKSLDNPSNFRLYFFGYDVSLPSEISSTDISIIVENRQPSLSNVPPRTVTQSPSAPSTYLISITAYNNGSVPVRIVSVRPIGDGRVSPAGEYYCNIYGFPPAICPSDNGFGKTINVGDRQRVYVIYTGELNGNIFNLEYEPLQPVCSDATKFNLTVNINLGNNTPTSCTIAPRHLSLTPSEIHEWVVTCYNSADRVVPCVGDNWYFEDAYGGFIEKTNTRAKGYVRSVAGLFPTLVYQTDSVRCESELSINPNEPESPNDPYSFVCQLTPESAELSVGENQRFVLNCSLEGTPVSPTDARYDLVNGLEGTLGDASITGVTFTATTNSSGDVQVIAWYTAPGDPTLRGAIDWAHVVVGAGRNETGNETEERRGDVCELIPGYMEKYQHDAGYVGILCGEGEEKGPCSSTTTINWNVAPDLYGRVITPTTNGARFTIGSEGGTPTAGPHTGGITAVIVGSDGNPLGQCWADINILESTCLDYS